MVAEVAGTPGWYKLGPTGVPGGAWAAHHPAKLVPDWYRVASDGALERYGHRCGGCKKRILMGPVRKSKWALVPAWSWITTGRDENDVPTKGRLTLIDIIPLCPDCELVHRPAKQTGRRREKQIAWLAMQHKATHDEAKRWLETREATRIRLVNVEWDVDLSRLGDLL